MLLCTEQSGVDNLSDLGIPGDKIHLVGNLMIDTLLKHQGKAQESTILTDLQIEPGEYAVLTLHRPSNVDHPQALTQIVKALRAIQSQLKIVFPMHPRTRKKLEEFGLMKEVGSLRNLLSTKPLGYLDFLRLTNSARMILTDSGGIQEEACIMKVPCITIRPNTERPSTLFSGGNTLVASRSEDIVQACERVLEASSAVITPPPLWDGGTAHRICTELLAAWSR
jgi:UDP-N-acetylglucosamine 2-epimerase (non-hydrolysing)